MSTKSDNLVIVESPAKAKTISQFLGEGYTVLSSYGHIRDLDASSMSVDIPNNFLPEYVIPQDKERVVNELKRAVKKSTAVWLASDEDREGEAIAWHLYEVLRLQDKTTYRIAFHEITERAIKEAIQNPREINYHLVDAQQARRVLDRIVGFELSPVLWRRIGRHAPSAGRVQSVALRLVAEREREIQNFTPTSAFKLTATFADINGQSFRAECTQEFASAQEATAAMQSVIQAQDSYLVADVQQKPGKRSPSAPFTTSTLQQEAARRFGFPVSRTMSVAQKLYEKGYITYMRTDSVALSQLALAASATVVKELWGSEYYKKRTYTTKTKGAQEAHEAIRPTYPQAETIKGTREERALYGLIRKRTLASQMADAQIERTVALFSSDQCPYSFTATGEVITFEGFLKAYKEDTKTKQKASVPQAEPADEEKTSEQSLLPILTPAAHITLENLQGDEQFSRPAPRYTQASLVKKLEELGIGRPSTYAPTIRTIQTRGYVQEPHTDEPLKRSVLRLAWRRANQTQIETRRETVSYAGTKDKLLPTDIGVVVNKFLLEQFPQVVDYNFTAHVEEQFDRVAEGELPWQTLMGDFYRKFHPLVEQGLDTTQGRYSGERLLGSDPKSGLPVTVRIGRFGAFIQLGAPEEESGVKPRFVSLPKGTGIATITLQEALLQLELPRRLGEYDGSEVIATTGRFGPYVNWKQVNATIPKDMDLYAITGDEAMELIKAKIAQDEASLLNRFTLSSGEVAEVRQGRFGPYLKLGKKNIKLSGADHLPPESLTLQQVEELIQKAREEEKAGTPAGRRTRKSASKTAAASASKRSTAPAKTTAAKRPAATRAKSTATRSKSAAKKSAQ